MGFRPDVKRSDIYIEFDEDVRKKWFYQKEKQYLHNIDTFYYSISVKDDNKRDERLFPLFEELDALKDVVREKRSKTVPQYYDLNVMLGSYGMVYMYRLQEPDLFDIYFTHYLPNDATPRIVVQLRAYGLWLNGVNEMIHRSYNKVKEILSRFDLEISICKENRIDYAFHTNFILNPYKFFSDKNLDKYLYTNLSHYYKIGTIRRKKKKPNQNSNKSRFTLDYFALGQLKSNNLFNRNYNKVKEVIDLNYKSFFFQMWNDNGLISAYDKYCFEYAYQKKNYNAIHAARLKFYLEFGADPFVKREINLLFDKDYRYTDLEKLADKITPKTTMVMNIELQTKRKFYHYADEQINLLPLKEEVEFPLKRLFRILDNRKLFIDYITRESIAFIDKFEVYYDSFGNEKYKPVYRDFWKRLRSLKLECVTKDKDFLRDYSKKQDIEKMIKRSTNNIATVGLYEGNVTSNFVEDVSDLIGHLNDNDMKDIDLCVLDRETGEIKKLREVDFDSEFNEKYRVYKEKKNKAIKNRICDSLTEDSN